MHSRPGKEIGERQYNALSPESPRLIAQVARASADISSKIVVGIEA
jgi:hypothetical protein